MTEGIQRIETDAPQNHAENIDQQIDNRASLAVLVRSDRREKNRAGGTDTDTQNHGKGG